MGQLCGKPIDTLERPDIEGNIYVKSKARVEDLRKQYTITPKPLGEGSYGKVCRCVSKISNMERAVKYIKKKSIDDPKGIQRFQGEVNIMEALDHENIVKLYEVYECDVNFYLIMDLLKGGELFDEIVKR